MMQAYFNSKLGHATKVFLEEEKKTLNVNILVYLLNYGCQISLIHVYFFAISSYYYAYISMFMLNCKDRKVSIHRC